MNEPTALPHSPQIETASWARRVLALFVDWGACTLVVIALIGRVGWRDNPASGWYVLALFVAESALLTALMGGSFGQLMTRLRVVRVVGAPRPPDPLRSLLRQILVAMVIPPLVFRPDGRGLHDIVAGTATIKLAPSAPR